MPYIPQNDRDKLDPAINCLLVSLKLNTDVSTIDGALNYTITRLIKSMYEPRYFNYNRAIGMLECAKQELYRRVVGPYEDGAIERNGDL